MGGNIFIAPSKGRQRGAGGGSRVNGGGKRKSGQQEKRSRGTGVETGRTSGRKGRVPVIETPLVDYDRRFISCARQCRASPLLSRPFLRPFPPSTFGSAVQEKREKRRGETVRAVREIGTRHDSGGNRKGRKRDTKGRRKIEDGGRTQQCPRREAHSRAITDARASALTNGFVNRARFKLITQRKKVS